MAGESGDVREVSKAEPDSYKGELDDGDDEGLEKLG